jgi:uncharacterized damage-inducible protein DinB
MESVALIQRLHQHRAWVNDNLLATTATLSSAQLHQPMPIGQGSIWRSLCHLYGAEYVWLAALQGNDNPALPGDIPGKLPGNQLGDGGVKSLPELKQAWAELKAGWDSYLAGLTAQSLDEIVYKKRSGTVDNIRHGTRRADVLLHVCTHAQYTTAQVVNMFRHCGVMELPNIMLIQMARQENLQ